MRLNKSKQTLKGWVDYLNQYGCRHIENEICPEGLIVRINGIEVDEELKHEIFNISLGLLNERTRSRNV